MSGEIRTRDLDVGNVTLWLAELHPLAIPTGFEPVTFWLTTRRANHCAKGPSKSWGVCRDLNPSLLGHNQPCCLYTTVTTFDVLEWAVGLEPTASDLEGRRSAN